MIAAMEGKNSFLLENLDGKMLDAPINGRYLKPGMILGAKFRSWANFPWFFQKRDSLF
jgi:hypothetical protein